MATDKRVFTLRLQDDIFEKLEALAKEEHRSLTNLIEYILLAYLNRTNAHDDKAATPEK